MSVIAVDFDNVIMDPTNKEPGHRMGKPIDGAREAIHHLIAQGHTVIVFTERGNSPGHVWDWLAYFHFPSLAVTDIKPKADVYLDDKAVRFHYWAQALIEIDWALS